jgi:uncharacterized BrkB/YihY/UPF0761 family membrane protein
VTPERILRRLRAELRLSGIAAWRGVVELVNSNDVTHAASIAYYALLSFFPFLLLVFSLLGSITDDAEDRLAVLTFVFRYFPARLDFVTNQLDAFTETRVQLGVAGALALRSQVQSTKPGASRSSAASGSTASSPSSCWWQAAG